MAIVGPQPPHGWNTPFSRWDRYRYRVWDEVLQEWVFRTEPDAGTVRHSPFWPYYIGAGSVLQRSAEGMPIDPNSAAMAAWMDANSPVPGTGAFGDKTALNTSQFGTRPIAAYLVDSSDPACETQTMDTVSGINNLDRPFLLGDIPWPHWMSPATNGDRSLALYDIGTGIMREYFFVQPVGDPADRVWRANSAGWSLAYPGLRTIGATNYPLQLRGRTSAAVGMHNPLGFIGVSEARRGRIDHAVCFTTGQMQQGWSWPAVGGDGTSSDTDAPVEGQWCRLPMSVNPDDYQPLTALIIRAFQQYGGYATDKNLWCHAFNAESGALEEHFTGADPWAPGGELQTMYGTLSVKDFPWHLTEWAPRDYGRPTPDWGSVGHQPPYDPEA